MNNKITIDIDEIRNMPDGSVTDAETIRQIAIYCIKNHDIMLSNKIDGRFGYAGLYPDVHYPVKTKHTKERILSELNVAGEVIAIYPYGSRVYGTANEDSDYDYIIVMKSGMLENGAFRNNAISSKDHQIQGVVYSRGGFINALNNYEIGALECLSLPKEDVILSKWPFKLGEWDEKAMVKSIIKKASASRHNADQQSKNGNKWIGKKSMYHALRILNFGIQLKEHKKIIDFSQCNNLYKEIMQVEDKEFDTRDYYGHFKELINKLRE